MARSASSPRGNTRGNSQTPGCLSLAHPQPGKFTKTMKVVIHDLDKLISFYEHVKRFNAQLESEFDAMAAHSHEIGQDWADPQYERFVADFEEAARGMRAFLGHREAHERYLAQVIERAVIAAETRM